MTGPQIQEARESAGLTRCELAERLDVSAETLRSWEMGRRNPCCQWMHAAIERATRPKRTRATAGGGGQ